MTTISPHGIGTGNYHPSDTVVTAAPPPAEVKIRTMRSDLESMAKSGGGLPRFQTVKVPGLSSQVTAQTVVMPGEVGAIPGPQSNKTLIILAVVVGLIVVAAAGWFGYSYLTADHSAAPNPQAPAAPSSTQTQSNSALAPTTTPVVALAQVQTPSSASTTTASSPASAALFTHVSVFKIPADQTLAISFSAGAAQSASDLESYSQKITSLVATAKPSATFLEIDAKNTQDKDASINDLFSAASAPVLSSQILAADFKPDATFFVYRDKNGLWPGYVLQVAPLAGEAGKTLQNNAQAIEQSEVIPGLFLANPGTPSPNGFSSSTIAGLPVRILSFTGGTVPSTFVYGWANNNQYLILSTSPAGFADAVKHLQ